MKLERFGCGLQVKFAGDESNTKTGVLSGYGAVFGNKDSYGDVIAKGAFKDSLRDWKKRDSLPKMLLQHGGFIGPAEDGIPVGKWTDMREDDTGLYVEGELFALDTQKGRYIHEGLKSGALDGLSIGYVAREVAYGKKPEEPARTIKKIDLFEVSIVTFPANSEARVGAVKAADVDLATAIKALGRAIKIHEGHMDGSIDTDEESQQEMMNLMKSAHGALTDAKPMEGMKYIEQIQSLAGGEAYLRDVVGLSQRQAVAFVSRIKSLRPSDSGMANAMVEQLKRLRL